MFIIRFTENPDILPNLQKSRKKRASGYTDLLTSLTCQRSKYANRLSENLSVRHNNRIVIRIRIACIDSHHGHV